MSNEIGSFVVNIKAQIEGYQEQINAIKAKLAEIGKDTDIGKEIAKSLKLAESQVERLGKTMDKRISSESQITALTDNLQNISRLIMDIGDSFGKVTWDDLNVDGLRDKIQSTKTEIDNLTNSMQENVSKGFAEALASSVEMRNVFESLKIDPAKMGVEEITEKLRLSLIQATSTLENYKAELDKITPKAEEAAQKMSNIEIDKSKIENAKNSLSSVFDNLKLITTQTRTVDIYKSDDFFKAIEEKCNSLYDTVNDKGKGIIDKIREIVSWDAVGEKDPSKLRSYLQEINNLFKDLNGRSLSGNVTGFGDRINEIFENLTVKNIETSITGLDKFRVALENLFANNNNFGMDSADAKNFIDKILNVEATKESIDTAEKEVANAIKNYLTKVSKDYKEASQEAGALSNERKTAQQKYEDAKANSAAIKTAETKYLAEIKALENKNAELQTQLDNAVKRLEALEKESESRKNGKSPMGDFGNKQKRTAAQYYNDASNAAGKYSAQLEQVKAREQAIGNIQSFVQRWFSVYAAARLVSNAFKSMKTNLKDLDDIMTQISIVTDKTQGDLWKQMPQYSDMAKQYASSIKGVYEVSQLYYQQGLGQNDVMALTEQTLKMAKISGLEYATATDYMTNAVRSFKMEMSDAQTVVDVYSAIAASSATNTAELATAMSKTASSAQAVGSSFENTSAMMAVMIEATRESAENIGSAMKSIISRYGEMTKSPSKLIDSEGEAMSLNKVDTALQSVGISIHDAQGQFRDFDDVITELSGSWDKIDKNTQRYIATVMAGNRQQSRFLALVSNGERLEELTEKAANAEDTATLQVLKTMDSISAKAQQLQTSLQGLYTESGFEDLYKGVLDNLTRIIDTFNSMPKMFNSIPVTAIATFAQLFVNIGSLIGSAVSAWKAKWSTTRTDLENAISNGTANGVQAAQLNANSLVRMFESAANRIKNVLTGAIAQGTSPTSNELITTNTKYQPIEVNKKWSEEKQQAATAYNNTFNTPQTEATREKNYQQALNLGLLQSQTTTLQKYSNAARAAGAGLQILSATMDKTTRSGEKSAAAVNLLGGALTTAGYIGMGPMGWAGAAVTAITTLINVTDAFIETSQEKVKRLQEAATKSNNEFLQKKTDYKELDEQIKKVDELKKARFDSAEANKEYLDASNALASLAPELISYIDSEGNAVLDLSKSYEVLSEARRQAAESGKEAGQNSVDLALAQEDEARINYEKSIIEAGNNLLNSKYNNGQSYMAEVADSMGLSEQKKIDYQTILKDFYKSDYSKGISSGDFDLSQALEKYVDSEVTKIQSHSEEFFELVDLAITSAKEGVVQSAEAFDISNIDFSEWADEAEEIDEWALGKVESYINDVKNGKLQIPYQQLFSSFNSGINWESLNAATQEAISNYLKEVNWALPEGIKVKSKVPKIKDSIIIPEELQANYDIFQDFIQKYNDFQNANEFEKSGKTDELLSSIVENRTTLIDLVKNDNDAFWNLLSKNGIDTEEVKQALTYMLDITKNALPAYQQKIAKELNTRNQELQSLQTSIWLNAEALKNSKEEKDINIQEMLEKLPNANDLITQYITSQFDDFDGARGTYADIQFQQDYSDIIDALTKLYTNILTGDSQKQFAQLIENKGKYSEKELNAKIASLIGENELDPVIQKAISKYYEKVLNPEKVNQLLEARTNKVNIDNLDNVGRILNGEIDLGADELQKFVEVYDNIALLQKNGSLSMEEASSALEQYATILATIRDGVPADKIDEVSNIVENWDDFSLIGLDELRKKLKDVGLNDNLTNQLIQQATDFSKLIPENLIVDFDSLSQKIVTESENFSKALSKASKGMDIKDATEMASKLDVSVTDFTFKNGKYFIENAEAIQQAYTGISDQLMEDLNTEYNSELQSLYTKANQARQNGDTQRAKEFYKQTEELEQKKTELDTVIEQWGKYQTAEVLLQMGQIDAFLNLLKVDDADRRTGIEEAIKSGNVEKIASFEELSPFIESIVKVYGETFSGLANQLADSVSKGAISVQKTGTNDSYLESLVSAGLADYTADNQGIIIDVTGKTFEDARAWLEQANPDISNEEYGKLFETLFDAFNKDLLGKFNALLTDTSVSMKDALAYTLASGKTTDEVETVMSELGFTFDEVTQSFINNTKDYEGLKNKLEEIIKGSDNLQEVNEAKAKLAKLENEPIRNLSSSVTDLVQHRNDLTEDMIKNFANAIGEDFDALIDGHYFSSNGKGGYRLDRSGTLNLLIAKYGEASEVVNNFKNSLFDSAIADLEKIGNIQFKGTTNFSDMQTAVDNINSSLDSNLSVDEIFEYNDKLQAWVYSQEGIKSTVEAAKKEAEKAGKDGEDTQKILEKTIGESFLGDIDLSSFISGNLDKTSQQWTKIQSAISAYNIAIEQVGGQTVQTAEALYSVLSEGGNTAIEAARALAEAGGQDFNAEDAKTAYMAEVNKLKSASETISSMTVGSVVDNSIVSMLSEIEGYRFTYTSEGLWVTEAVGSVAAALLKAYNEIASETSEATIEEINAAGAKYYTALDNENGTVDAISALKNAMNMSYDDLGKLFASKGQDMVALLGENFENAADYGIKRNFDGTVQIFDFDSLASKMNWDPDSPEYVEALNQYHDSLITYNKRVSDNIKDEFGKLTSTNIGDEINLTYLVEAFGENTDKLASLLGVAPEDLTDGIVTATKDTASKAVSIMAKIIENQGSIEGIDLEGLSLDEIWATYNEIIKNAQSEISSAQSTSILSSQTAALLVSYNSAWSDKLSSNGTIVLSSAEEYIQAASDIYQVVKESFEAGKSDLQTLNNSYSDLIKANNSKDISANTILSSASNLSTDTLNNFMTSMGWKLESILNESGDVIQGWTNSIERTGIDNYQVKNWDLFKTQIEQAIGHKLDETSNDYINSYINWLESEANTAPGAKEALMTSLIPNLEKLSYAEIGQIAKTFEMTVEQVLALVENNGDNTFNAKDLLNVLPIDKTNEEFARALSTQLQSVTSNMTSAMIAFVEAGADGKRTDLDFSNLKNAISDFEKGIQALGQNVSVQNLVLALTQGGEAAVAAAEQIAALSGQELSASDVATLYQGQVSKLVNAVNTVVAQPGEIVDAVTASIIGQSGGQVSQLGTTGQYVVESAANLYEAYNNLLQKMAATGEATLADLNNVAAKALENRDGEQQIIDALGDASSMTYTRFGEILAQQGIELTEQLVDSMTNAGIIKQLGGANMAITDFKGLADIFGWDANSEQFVSAFKTYNDSLIQMNRQAERNILEEAQSVASAQGGDWINLTQLADKLQETIAIGDYEPDGRVKTSLKSLNDKLAQYGAYIEDDILKIGETADIPSIMQAVAQAAAESGGLLSNEMAQLADTVADAIKGYADLISGGIEGSLTNTQAEQLQDWANKNGVGQLDFTPTEKGLKVATAQAQKLVAALKKVDSIQGKLTFDKMVESLSTDKGGKFSNISKTTAEIAKAERKIEDIDKEIANLTSKQRIDGEQLNKIEEKRLKSLEAQKTKLQEQINSYREIQEAQSMDPSQYNFMDRDLPEQLQGPINYWDSVGKAFTAMNEASQTGKMAINDFYNIVNEMENLANISGEAFNLAGYQIGGEASEAAKLIQDGLGSLTNIDGKGVKVDLSKLGIDFVSGADNAKQNFADGVNALAESQIAMIDAAIRVLEIVVAMEELGKVDVEGNNNGVIDLSEIFGEGLKFDPGKGFDENYSEAVDALLKKAENDADLKDALNSVKVNGKSMYEMLDAARGTVDEQARKWKELNMSEEQYQAVINSFYQALQNGDYNLDSIQSSVWEILDQVMPDGTVIDVGDRSIIIAGGTHTQINWEDKNSKEALKNFEGNLDKQKEEVIKSIQRYKNGKPESIDDVLITLATSGKIKITNKGKGKGFDIEGPNGEKIDPKSKDGQKIIADAALKDAGIKDGQVYETEAGTIEARGTVRVGDKKITVTSDGEGNVKYHSDTLGQDFSSLDELLHAEYDKYVERQESAGMEETMSYEAWLHSVYNVTVISSAIFKNKNGEVVDPASDPEFQKTLSDFYNQNHKAVQDYLNDTSNWSKDGDIYTLKLPDGQTIQVEAPDYSAAAGQVEDKILEVLNPIAASVKTGIEKAFQGEGEDSVQSAITKAIQSALGLGGGTGGAGNEIPIPQIVLQPSSITIDIAQAGQPTLSNTNGTRDLQMDEVTVKPTNVKLNLDGYTPSTEDVSGASSQEVPISSVTLKPDDVKLDLTGYTPTTEGENVSNENVPIGGVTLQPKNITIDTGSIKPEAIESLEADVSTVKATPSAAPTIKTEGLQPSTIGTLNATVTNVNATAESVEVTSIGEQIVSGIQAYLDVNPVKPKVESTGAEQSKKPETSENTTTTTTTVITVAMDDSAAQETLSTLKTSIEETVTKPVSADTSTADTSISTLDTNAEAEKTKAVKADTSSADKSITTLDSNAKAEKTKTVKGDTSSALEKVKDLNDKAKESVSKTVNVKIDFPDNWKDLTKTETKVIKVKEEKTGTSPAKGNVALSKGTVNNSKGKAYSRGNTLMGELGPELVVSNGSYHLVGVNGPEMVDLAPDAIVFNHIQTRQLMSNGKTGTHGTPITNEKKATSFATGNFAGPAMASASEALALLKQLRAMWQSLADASLADMGGNAGRGGGGGGGGGGNNDEDRENYYAGINEAVDRWYNWLKKIENTQIRINKLTKEYNLLEEEGLSTEKKLANLQDRQKSLKSNKETRDQLVKEQKDVRADLIKSANKGLFSAFYEADPETGLISLKNDESFVNFLKATDDNGSNKELIKQIKDGQSIANKTITRKYSDTELKEIGARKFDSFNLKETINAKQLKGLNKTQKKFYEKTTDKNGKTVYKLKSDARENYAESWKNAQKKKNKDNKPITLTRDIKTGLDFISELQATDEAGNLIHDAADQLSLIKAMGLWTEDLELGIDKEQDGWEQQVVERFFGKIDQDKSDIEGLTDSINEQEEASLDDAIAIQEINDQIRELVQPVTGVTDGLTKWYNETQKIKTAQAEINKLTKELSNLQNDFEANGFKIFKNYKDQEDSLNRQNKINEELLKKRENLAGTLTSKYSDLINKGIISVDENGTATFSDYKVNKGEIQTSYQQIVTNDQGYQIDEEGKYVDDKGILRDKEGKEIKDENAHFGVLKYEEVTGRSYNTTGKSFEQIIEDITSQNALGEVAYNAEEQYQILKSLGLEDFMKYDEKGNKIYDDFGELSKEDMQKAVEAGIKRIQGSVDEINENNDEMANLEQEQLEIQSQLQSIQKALIDNQIEVENLVKDAVVQEHQDAIDAKKAFADAISNAASKTIEGMRKSLDNEKKRNESDKDNKELTLLQMQLTTAQMSGSSVSKIRDLQKQIQDKQQEMYYNEREALISELEEQTNETVEALNDQTEIAQTALDYQVKYGEIWEEVNKKLTKSPEALVNYISENQPDFLSKSENERKTLLTNIRDKVQTFSSDIKYQELPNERDNVLSDTKYSDERFKNNDVKEEILKAGQEAFRNSKGTLEEANEAAKRAMIAKADNYAKTFANQDRASTVTNLINNLGNITSLNQESSVQSARKAYDSLGDAKNYVSQETLDKLIAAEKKINELKQPKIETSTPEQTQEQTSEPTQEQTSEPIQEQTSEPKKEVVDEDTPPSLTPEQIWEKNRKLNYNKNKSIPGIHEIFGRTKKIIKGNKNISNQEAYAILKNQYLELLRKGKTESQIAESWNKVADKTIKTYLVKGMKALFKKTVAFKKGGDIDFTGPAWVDGTKNEPEHIFNFKQMEALRAHLLSGVDTTSRAVAGLSNIIENLPNANTYNNINNDNSGISINNLEFHMEVKEISNDYDARRAGQQAMEEMVRIAYKAGNRSISRR